ncbi:hypothetical protein CK203_086712 [Vitis vinifera]|uniref:Uncharacterized protein n=1 Tax=Vitis vinifera TaxID=29760 RepID=A0A438EEV9_VITVI|nr:hypothetical protein CK203_086712 [Vitis vinifera]
MNEKRKRENVLNFLKFQESVGLLYEIQSISQRQAVVVLTVSKGDVSGICPSSPSHIHTVTPTYISSDLEYQKPTDDRNDKREGANGAAEMESPETSTAVTTPRFAAVTASLSPLDLTEDNVRQVLADARVEASRPPFRFLAQIFDNSVGITGEAELAELDGPFVKISLRGRFWHKRSTVLARVANYLKQRIPEILEVDIEDEKQLDDSPENF